MGRARKQNRERRYWAPRREPLRNYPKQLVMWRDGRVTDIEYSEISSLDLARFRALPYQVRGYHPTYILVEFFEKSL